MTDSESIEDRLKRLQAEKLALEKILEAATKAHAAELDSMKKIIWGEQQMRAAAQRGLVPYVRGLEFFDRWLLERSDLRVQLEPILRELKLWEIKLGYDPDQDLTLSVISPHHI